MRELTSLVQVAFDASALDVLEDLGLGWLEAVAPVTVLLYMKPSGICQSDLCNERVFHQAYKARNFTAAVKN